MIRSFSFSFAVLGVAALAAGVQSARAASAEEMGAVVHTLAQQLVSSAQENPGYMINWKIGDDTMYNLAAGGGAISGTMHKYVAQDDNNGSAVWINEDMDLMGQSQKVEMLLDRNNGNILKLRENGQDQQIPTDKPQIISENKEQVTVPAGTFASFHIKAKQSGKAVELWMNSKDTCMDGVLKEVADTGSIGDMTLELTSFKKAN